MENTAGTDPTNETGEAKLNAKHVRLSKGHGIARQTGEKKHTGQEKGSRHESKQ